MRRIYWVLLLLACVGAYALYALASPAYTHQDVAYGDTVRLYFDERQWQLGADNAKNNIFYEYVTDGQTVDNWKELVTLQMYKGRQTKVTAAEHADMFIALLNKTCGGKAVVTVLRRDPADCLFEWKINGHARISDQHEIDRVIAGKQSLIFIHYVAKTPALSAGDRRKWIDILDKAAVK